MSKSNKRANNFPHSTAEAERKKERKLRMLEVRKTAHTRGVLPVAFRTQMYETAFHNWMVNTGTRQDHFALLIGCTRGSVRNWRYGQVMPSLVYAFRIEALTRGAVPVTSWMDTPAAKWLWDQCLSVSRTPTPVTDPAAD